MQKATSVVLGSLVIAVIALLIWFAVPRRPAAAVASSASAPPPRASAADADAGSRLDLLLSEARPLTSKGGGEGPGARLLDGTIPPPLPDDAPRSLRFGVVLVQYRGAQRAGLQARSKPEALELAKTLAQLGQTDFKAAVEKGDSGSAADLGRIQAGILEPAPNYVLFTLPAGGVGGPVDTPTGYWVMKNLGK